MLGSLVLPPFSSEILADNGAAQLMLTGIHPALMSVGEAPDFMLSASEAAFMPEKRGALGWHQAPTVFVSSARLKAVISAADVSAIDEYPVTVWDPNPAPVGSETAALIFRVVPQIFELYLPQVGR